MKKNNAYGSCTPCEPLTPNDAVGLNLNQPCLASDNLSTNISSGFYLTCEMAFCLNHNAWLPLPSEIGWMPAFAGMTVGVGASMGSSKT